MFTKEQRLDAIYANAPRKVLHHCHSMCGEFTFGLEVPEKGIQDLVVVHSTGMLSRFYAQQRVATKCFEVLDACTLPIMHIRGFMVQDRPPQARLNLHNLTEEQLRLLA